MRAYLRDCLSSDRRIRITLGDPLEELRNADVLVHPSYSDGFGYAPMEAIACGIPVIVTEDTGMKELIVDGVNGWVVPTGDSSALLERLETLRQVPGARSLFSPLTRAMRVLIIAAASRYELFAFRRFMHPFSTRTRPPTTVIPP